MTEQKVTPANAPKTSGNTSTSGRVDFGSANYGRLSDVFKVLIVECDRDGNPIQNGLRVECVALEGNISNENNWTTPFESSNPDNSAPKLIGMLQSGEASQVVSSLGLGGGDLESALSQVESRTSFTKVNSTMVFTSSQSAQIQMTLFFRAWKKASVEVEQQIRNLQKMSVAVNLAEQGLLVNGLNAMGVGQQGLDGENTDTTADSSGLINGTLDTLLPSTVPCYVALYYGRKRYAPMIIQTFSRDIVGQMDKVGNMLWADVPVTFMSRQAWDRRDIV